MSIQRLSPIFRFDAEDQAADKEHLDEDKSENLRSEVEPSDKVEYCEVRNHWSHQEPDLHYEHDGKDELREERECWDEQVVGSQMNEGEPIT